jgi:hypothetical protein
LLHFQSAQHWQLVGVRDETEGRIIHTVLKQSEIPQQISQMWIRHNICGPSDLKGLDAHHPFRNRIE